MEEGVYDVTVVGAGIQGSSTAYTLAKDGYNVLLLEQFTLPHTRGSSHGQSRIIRKAYSQVYYSNMMTEAYTRWQHLEMESGLSLFKRCGLLVLGQEGCEDVKRTRVSLSQVGAEFEILTGDEVSRRFPGLSYPSSFTAVYEPGAGIIRADLSLRAYQTLFVNLGGKLVDGSPVLSIRPGHIIRVTTPHQTYQTRRLVITAGPWSSKLIQPLGLHPPLQPLNVSVAYWKERTPGIYHVDNGFPSVAPFPETKTEVSKGSCMHYTVPVSEYTGFMKICLHSGPKIDPDRRDEVKDELEANLQTLQTMVRKHYPGVEDKPSIIEKCIYTMTPDEDFILDTHPAWKNIVIGAGFSGHGFKLAPIVGKLLSELVTGKTPSYDLTPFRLDRFLTKTSKL